MSEPTEAVCVCGHPESDHYKESCLHEDVRGRLPCRCTGFRASLPWPNEEGLWWMALHSARAVVEAFRGPCDEMLVSTFLDEMVRSDAIDAGARFSKVIEQSPYGTTP